MEEWISWADLDFIDRPGSLPPALQVAKYLNRRIDVRVRRYIANELMPEISKNRDWSNEFHGVCPQCGELFILRRSFGVDILYMRPVCTECRAAFDGDLLKQILTFLKEKPND